MRGYGRRSHYLLGKYGRYFNYQRDRNSIFIECMHEDVQQDNQLDQLKELIGDYGKALQQAGYQVP